ncbi:MAG: hypothetical protein LBH29_03360 [Elusimicrobiota bacterium]|jgi:hypothetical protein|nr:hypothetical protein [Elusimicrobiota bacterium]
MKIREKIAAIREAIGQNMQTLKALRIKREIEAQLDLIDAGKPIFVGERNLDKLGYLARQFSPYLDSLARKGVIKRYSYGIDEGNRFRAAIAVTLNLGGLVSGGIMKDSFIYRVTIRRYKS